MKNSARFVSIAILLGSISPSQAQDAAKLQESMNNSDICSPLSFDGAQIIDLFDPSDTVKFLLRAVDTKVAWDKNFHEVREFKATDGSITVKAKLGCQPSSEGAGAKILDMMGVGVDQLELKDNLSCSGPAASITCTISGGIGKYLGKQTNITGKMQNLVNSSM